MHYGWAALTVLLSRQMRNICLEWLQFPPQKPNGSLFDKIWIFNASFNHFHPSHTEKRQRNRGLANYCSYTVLKSGHFLPLIMYCNLFRLQAIFSLLFEIQFFKKFIFITYTSLLFSLFYTVWPVEGSVVFWSLLPVTILVTFNYEDYKLAVIDLYGVTKS